MAIGRKLLRSSVVLACSVIVWLLFMVLHDRIFGTEEHESDIVKREKSGAGKENWDGKAPWLMGVDAEEVPEPVEGLKVEEPEEAKAPVVEVSDGEIEKMKIKELKVGLGCASLKCFRFLTRSLDFSGLNRIYRNFVSVLLDLFLCLRPTRVLALLVSELPIRPRPRMQRLRREIRLCDHGQGSQGFADSRETKGARTKE
jgi:hypothetical protein